MENLIVTIVTATRNRSNLLQTKAILSLIAQDDQDFEWVVVNDGADPQTREVVQKLEASFSIVYREMSHPQQGFGLAYGRNCGLEAATGDIICYLDDDNSLHPAYVEQIKAFFRNPKIKCSMARQSRHRDVHQDGMLIRQGKSFVSPGVDCTVEDLILHRQLFDSNGFAHLRSGALKWNPDYRIFVDYEFFLRCLDYWGYESFALNPEVLVDYVQSSEGIIGRSTYGDWAEEMDRLCASGHYPMLEPESITGLLALAKAWRGRQEQNIRAFAEKSRER
jgi:glycosyltransferase involved in cell wall biosynthesis